jgi:hypothetical protein
MFVFGGLFSGFGKVHAIILKRDVPIHSAHHTH